MASGTGKGPLVPKRFRRNKNKLKTAHRKRQRNKQSLTTNFVGDKVKTFAPQKPTIQVGPNPFPREWHVRLKYSHWTGIAAPITGLTGAINYRLNSLFDPDQSGVGHQPYQFDQISPLYKKAVVYAAKITLRWTNPAADGLYVGYCLTGDSMSGGGGRSLQYVKEMPYTQMKPINNSGSQVLTQTVYVDIAKYFNITRSQLFADEDNNMENTAGPAITRNCLLQIMTCDPAGGVTTNIAIDFDIVYYAKMFGLKDPGQS